MCRFSHVGRFRERPKTRKRVEKQCRKQPQKATSNARRKNYKKHHFGAKMAPQSDCDDPKSLPRRSWRLVAAKSPQKSPRHRSWRLRDAPELNFRVVKFPHRYPGSIWGVSGEYPGSLMLPTWAPGDGQLSKKSSINNTSTQDLTRRGAAGPANFFVNIICRFLFLVFLFVIFHFFDWF